ncbi:MAG: CesT family type III secretion system chaperone [Ramlibacter sp.]|nr:CesT family type III secretion system chaperone [Ramlibacter sp.]
MNSEQYQVLLQDLARLSGLADASSLLEHGRVKIGDIDAVLEHEPNYDPDLLQVRMRLGTLPDDAEDLTRAILEANYVSGYGGECVFSLYPASDDVVITMKVRLQESLTAQELWQGISDVARHGGQMWQGILSVSQTSMGSAPSDMRGMSHMPV